MNGIARKLGGALGVFTWLSGCATIVGIEDHPFDGGPGASPPPSSECVAYCDAVEQGCKGSNALYSTRDACLGTCAKLDPGDELEPVGNTVACRKKEAQRALDTEEPQTHCRSAGPGGAPTCGNNCDSWCTLLQETCPKEYVAMPNCQRACAALKDRGTFNLDVDHDGDTIQCRLEHVSNATGSPTAPQTHCGHAALFPTEYCRAQQDKPPDCAEFCRFNLAACTGDLTTYESTKQCIAVCMALDPGLNSDREQNTMGCRSWHTFNSLIDPVSHCAHTAPGGDGHCGVDLPGKTGNCESYCLLAQKACAADFTAKYASQAACQTDCSSQPDTFGAQHDSKYRLATAQTGNTLQCRLLHVSRALSEPAECANVFGQGACQ
jgi:hypothetical protein